MATDERDGFEEWLNGASLEGTGLGKLPIRLRSLAFAAYHARDAELADANAEIERVGAIADLWVQRAKRRADAIRLLHSDVEQEWKYANRQEEGLTEERVRIRQEQAVCYASVLDLIDTTMRELGLEP